MSITKNAKTKAFGVEQGYATYRLRQARYFEMAVDVSTWARQHIETAGQPMQLMDVGTYDGLARRYLEVHPGAEHIRYHAVDLFPEGREIVYKHNDWTLHKMDLDRGMPKIASAAYHVVVAEQVLEHLHKPGLALAEMSRILRPGGRLVVGVPIFPPGVAFLRKHVGGAVDRRRGVTRSHVQSWSKHSFLRLMRTACPELAIERVRGFRIISGGMLRPLEYSRWWWRLNRRVGALVPSLCIEIQVVARKPGRESHASHQRRLAA